MERRRRNRSSSSNRSRRGAAVAGGAGGGSGATAATREGETEVIGTGAEATTGAGEEQEKKKKEKNDSSGTEAGQVPALVKSSSQMVDAAKVVGCRKKKTRTVFSRAQVLQLESTFDAKRYLSSAERSNLATALRLTETQVPYRMIVTSL